MGTSDLAAADIEFGRAIVRAEAAALAGLADRLGADFARAVEILVRCADTDGTVLITGLGKSGHIGAKISATMASLGIPSHAVHPSEAAHGDLGRFRSRDAVVAISFSGETDEVCNLCALLKQDGLPIISITGGPRTPETPASTLERLATVALTLGFRTEATPDSVAPTSSTTATLALGDALALATARRRNFTDEDFARRHPGGALGGLLKPVTQAMRAVAGRTLPLVSDRLSVAAALTEAAKVGRRPGAMLLVDDQGCLSGIFTDADLRRLVLRDAAELTRPIADVMTRTPRTLPHTALVRDAVLMIREHRQDEIPVVDEQRRPVGMLDVQDLIATRLVRD